MTTSHVMVPGSISFPYKDVHRDPQRLFNLRALTNQKNLSSLLGHLETQARNGTLNTDTLLCVLERAKTELDGLGSFLSAKLDPAVYAEICPARSAGLAMAVFAIPELREMILSYLNIPQLLVAQSISRAFNEAIASSRPLQRQMSLDYMPMRRHLSTPLKAMPGFVCGPIPVPGSEHHIIIEPPHPDQAVVIHAEFSKKFPRIGLTGQSMLLCDPPIREMTCFTSCCIPSTQFWRRQWNAPPDVQAPWMVRSHTGLTVGDLHDVAAQAMYEHRNCVSAHAKIHHPVDGTVVPRVIFQGIMPVWLDDPILVRRREKLQRERQKTAVSARMEAFAIAKRTAAALHLPIPTLEQFDERRRKGISGWLNV